MTIQVYERKRSIESIIVEKMLLFRGTKKEYSTIENPLYPKVPHYNHKHAYEKVLKLCKEILSTVESPQQVILMGDSSGGSIALSLAQLLKENGLPQPKEIVLFSACVDMTYSNPEIEQYDKVDNMLSTGGMSEITKLWAGELNPNDPLISPIHADLKGVAKISHFIGTHEILYPDAIKFDEIMMKQGVKITTYVFPKMSHVFVVMPIREAKAALNMIKDIIEN